MNDLTPPPDEPLPGQTRSRLRAELLEAAQAPPPARRWLIPGAVAVAVVLVVGLAAWAVQAGNGTQPDTSAPPVAATSTSAAPTPVESPSTLPSESPSRSAGHQAGRGSCADELVDVLPGAR